MAQHAKDGPGIYVSMARVDEDDPLCLRAAIDGTEDTGYSLLYSGNLQLVSLMIERALVATRRTLVVNQQLADEAAADDRVDGLD